MYRQTENDRIPDVLADVVESNNGAFIIIIGLNCIISDSGSMLHCIICA